MHTHQRTRTLVTLLAFCFIVMHCHATTVGQQYTLVHDFSELSEGEEFILVNPYYKRTVGAYYSTSSTHRFSEAQISFDGETATITDDKTTAFVYTTLTRKTSSGKDVKYTFMKTADKGEYIYHNSADSKTQNNVYTTSELNSKTYDYANCSFVFSSSDNTVSIDITDKELHFGCNYTNADVCIWYFSSVKNNGNFKYRLYKKATGTPQAHITINGTKSDAANTDILKPYDGQTVASVTLQRAFAADGGWYTLCLPFALSADDIDTQFKGALFNEFSGVEVWADGTAHLQFKKVTETKAGVPYMVLPKETVETPTFNDKTIDATAHTTTHTCDADGTLLSYAFIGLFDPALLSDSHIRFVSGDKGTELVIPDGPGTIKGLRAYFLFPDNMQGVTTLSKLNVDDGTTTAIHPTDAAAKACNSTATCYTLSGHAMPMTRLKTSAPGIYIINGKKVAINK